MEVFAYVFFCILLSSVSLIESNVAEIEPENQLAGTLYCANAKMYLLFLFAEFFRV